ncbi:MAG: hypothetical protein A3A44_03355 [Candidatus Sungbacteria bacterium RIFCSPLOWO2_01_FULL_60_25]|uniref:Uncharacterized protein n=1 Tax=Candidatus Sungbacteria bacterium RIFCSPLOWO2_01_FULL_60_25 TaxID=1802281 RepID=A0A1G2LDL4_9BACT|nr:MAG: hypothetical protein A3A44_03355 [Candidatus Sungbacteria bacterium RIFCSPLOWO2_01_FULL_60_25]
MATPIRNIRGLGRPLAILGIAATGLVVFLFAAGYLQFVPPFSFAFSPQVEIVRSPYSPTGWFGSNYPQGIAAFDVITKPGSGSPAILERIAFAVAFDKLSSQRTSGLKDFQAVYVFCQNPGYGYPPPCIKMDAYPSAAQTTAKGALVTFQPKWPVYEKATSATVYLMGNISYTGTWVINPQQVRAEIPTTANVVATVNGRRVAVLVKNAVGNWLRVNYGYGYPRPQ